MAGYNWIAGKSNNAVFAEENGFLPKSRITTVWLKAGGVGESAAFVKWLIAKNCISYDEWHHTSKFFKRTPFYGRESIAEQLADLAELKLLEPYREAYADRVLRAADPWALRAWAIEQARA
ncbi:hypothetical protein [Trueperella pyogenes]